MALKVDDQYYCGVCDTYTTQVGKVETQIEQFKTIYMSLFENNDFGDILQASLQGKADSFYNAIQSQLSSLMSQISQTTNSFLNSVDTDDNLW